MAYIGLFPKLIRERGGGAHDTRIGHCIPGTKGETEEPLAPAAANCCIGIGILPGTERNGTVASLACMCLKGQRGQRSPVASLPQTGVDNRI